MNFFVTFALSQTDAGSLFPNGTRTLRYFPEEDINPYNHQKMKLKNNKFGAVLMSMALCFTATSFTACGDDEESGIDPTEKSYTAACTYSVELSADMLEMADVTISYFDAAGDSIAEPLTSSTWSVKVTKACPASFKDCTVTATLKEDAVIDSTRDYSFKVSTNRLLIASDGTSVTSSLSSPSSTTSTLKAENVTEERIKNAISRLNCSFGAIEVTESGTIDTGTK